MPKEGIFSYKMSIKGQEIAVDGITKTIQAINDFKETFEDMYYRRFSIATKTYGEGSYLPDNEYCFLGRLPFGSGPIENDWSN
jgi:hypothetical protein